MQVQGDEYPALMREPLGFVSWLCYRALSRKRPTTCLQTSVGPFEEWGPRGGWGRWREKGLACQLWLQSLLINTASLTNWKLGQIYEFSKLNQNGACSDLQKVTQPDWIFVSIPWPKIKWVNSQDRFRNGPVYPWKLWVSVWVQIAWG